MTTLGVDYSGRPPGGRVLATAGYRFACRYLSPPPNPKNLTAAEVASLTAAGIDIVTVWESTSARVLGGEHAGRADGTQARFMADSLGAPERAAIYYAVDFDAQPSQWDVIGAYQAAFAAAISPHPVGVYGGYRTVVSMLARSAVLGWQTAAWSGGKRSPRACLYQRVQQVVVGGTACDVDEASGEYGGWMDPAPSHPSPLALPPALGGPEEDTVLIPVQLPKLVASSGYWDCDGNPGKVGDPANPPRPFIDWATYRGISINGDDDAVDDNDGGRVRANPHGLPDGRQFVRVSFAGFPVGSAPLVWVATNVAS